MPVIILIQMNVDVSKILFWSLSSFAAMKKLPKTINFFRKNPFSGKI